MAQVMEHVYVPRGAARTLFETRDDELLLAGPAGTGKSRACLEKLNAVALKYPGMRGLICRKWQVSLGSSALKTWREAVVKEALETGDVSFYGGSPEEPPQYRYSNGSTILICGMDKSSKIMSTEYDCAYVQEATELSEGDWEDLTTRLRNGVMPYQQLIADCNPDSSTHWLKLRCDLRKTTMLHSLHEDNPVYFDDDGQLTPEGAAYLAKLDALTGVRHARLRLGKWVAAEGAIYDGWDPAVHIVDPFVIPDEWTRWWSVDFGYTNAFTCQWWAEDHDGRLWLYRELYMTKRLVEDHARQILDQVTDEDGNWTEPKPRAVVCDHAAEDRATLERHLGLSTSKAHKTVSDGLQAVAVRLRPAGDGKPRLHAMRDVLIERDADLVEAKRPTCLVEEIPGYVWAPNKEEPVKLDDHAMDAMRYVVAEVDLGARPRVRFI